MFVTHHLTLRPAFSKASLRYLVVMVAMAMLM